MLAVWAYAGNPFGEQQPTSSSGYVLNLRYPGQYADQESGLVSNGFRDCYEPATGRYCQSDPTGLDGGISTFTYGLNNPLRYIDPTGLQEADPSEETPEESEALNPKLIPQPSLAPATEKEQEQSEGGYCPVNPKSWGAARRAYWQNEASKNPYKYSPENLNRMERGLAPLHDDLDVPMELHHVVPQRDGGSHDPSNLQQLWPWEHAEVDPYRYYNGPAPGTGKK